jgi:drug/metabolite transporter (DMT)-like permease
VIYGLLAALGWGTSDLGAAVATRRWGSGPVTLATQIVGLACLGVLILVTSPVWQLTFGDHLVLLGSGSLAGIAYFALYRGLELGPVALVSPIASAFAAVTVVLAVVLLDESLGGVEVAGIVATLVGVIMASTDVRRLGQEARQHRRGIPFGIAAMIGFGVATFVSGSLAQSYGWLPPVVVSRVGSLLLIGVVVAVTARRSTAPAAPVASAGTPARAETSLPRDRELLRRSGRSTSNLVLVAIVGITDVFGIASYSRGSELGLVSIVAATSATFTLIPVLGGVTIFRERPAPNQFVGVALVVTGLALLGLGRA